MTDWEIWACPAKPRADHDELDGSVQAAMRADAMFEAGDMARAMLKANSRAAGWQTTACSSPENTNRDG